MKLFSVTEKMGFESSREPFDCGKGADSRSSGADIEMAIFSPYAWLGI